MLTEKTKTLTVFELKGSLKLKKAELTSFLGKGVVYCDLESCTVSRNTIKLIKTLVGGITNNTAFVDVTPRLLGYIKQHYPLLSAQLVKLGASGKSDLLFY
jgi:hypothetical protein